MSHLLSVLPFLVVFTLLLSGRHMVFAGLAGMCAAFLFGNATWEISDRLFLDALHRRVGVEVPLIYGSLAVMLFEAGSFRAVGDLARYYGKGRRRLPIGLGIVALHALATYLFGSASSMTTIFAPILFRMMGARPGIVAALSIVSAVGFSTSPASTETFITARSAGTNVLEQSSTMLPSALGFYLLALVFAAFAMRGDKTKSDADSGEEPDRASALGVTWRNAAPVFVLLTLELACQPLTALGFPFLTPMSIMVLTILLTVFCTNSDLDAACRGFLAGSMKVAEKLFSIGIFLGCLNIIGESGAGSSLPLMLEHVPGTFRLPLIMIVAFFLAIPVGAHCSAILLILLPPLAAGTSLPQENMAESFGWIAIATALGAHLSPVQVNVLGLGSKFEIPVSSVICGNACYIAAAMLLLLGIAFISGQNL